MHLPVTEKIYLHDNVVFALDINLLRFWDKPSNDLFSTFRKNLMIRLIFVMYKSMPQQNQISACTVSSLFFVCLLVCGAPKMKSLILFI